MCDLEEVGALSVRDRGRDGQGLVGGGRGGGGGLFCRGAWRRRMDAGRVICGEGMLRRKGGGGDVRKPCQMSLLQCVLIVCANTLTQMPGNVD